jgi:hypothetical protein
MNEALRQQLIQMAEQDQRTAAELAKTGELSEGYAPRMQQVHDRNVAELHRIVHAYGWPGKSLVGKDGADAAWIIAQHGIGHPEFMRAALRLVRAAVEQGEADPQHAAFLHDRICFFERRPQRYGTQFDWDEQGEMNPWKLEDPDRVDEYRAQVGLGPMAERIAHARAREERDPDFKRKQAEMEAWARSVGWF